jgi:outer membrane lipoprotein SlyB
MRGFMAGIAIISMSVLAGCVNSVRPYEYSRAEAGQLVRVEAGTVVSATPVVLSSWVPFGLGPANVGRLGRERVRVDRNGELLSVTQGDDLGLPVGAPVWIQYGDRIRLLPKQ